VVSSPEALIPEAYRPETGEESDFDRLSTSEENRKGVEKFTQELWKLTRENGWDVHDPYGPTFDSVSGNKCATFGYELALRGEQKLFGSMWLAIPYRGQEGPVLAKFIPVRRGELDLEEQIEEALLIAHWVPDVSNVITGLDGLVKRFT